MMRIGNYSFKPGLFTTVLTLVVLVILVRLGVWQLDRAEEKRQILANQQAKLQLPVVKITDSVINTHDLEFRRVQVEGIFESRYQLFIDNKVHNGVPGYNVVTPLKIKDQNSYILVNRGWVPMNPDRRVLPSVGTPNGNIKVNGLIKMDPKDVADLGSNNRSNEGWPAVVRWVDLSAIQQETGLKLHPFLLLMDKDMEHGFVREWKFVSLPPEKSTSYAVTWFSLATVLLIIYLVVNIKRNKEHEQSTE